MIKRGLTEYYGVIENAAGELGCDKCGGKTIKTVMHMDFADHAVTQAVCSECNNQITIKVMRDKDDLMNWA